MNAESDDSGSVRGISRRRLMGGLAASGLAASARAAMPPGTWPLALSMGTGAPGSGFALYGPSWGQAVHEATAIPVSYRISGGAAANLLLIEQNAVQLGMTTLAVAASAWAGRGAWTGNLPLRDFRALFPVYRATLQIIAPYGSGMARPGDLDDASIGVGPAGGSGAVLVPLLLASLGITPRRLIPGTYAAQVRAMVNKPEGEISACAFLSATPSAAISAAARRSRFNLIGFTTPEIDRMRQVLPGLERVVIPRGSLPRQSAEVATIGTEAIAICRPELPNGLAGLITRAGLARRAALVHALPNMIPPSHDWLADDKDIAVHPGALQVLRRSSIPVPDRLARG